MAVGEVQAKVEALLATLDEDTRVNFHRTPEIRKVM
jgi:hypothetical protein